MPPAFLYAIEQTAFSTWLREAPTLIGFWFVLTFHALGLGMVVGTSSVIALRVLGVAPDLPLSRLKGLYPIVWAGVWIQVVSGILLTIAYPTKSFMTPAFYVKLGCIAAGVFVMMKLGRAIGPTSDGVMPSASLKRLAAWSLVLWFAAVTAGRLIGYTAQFIVHPGV
jgi:hypothetical protein